MNADPSSIDLLLIGNLMVDPYRVFVGIVWKGGDGLKEITRRIRQQNIREEKL